MTTDNVQPSLTPLARITLLLSSILTVMAGATIAPALPAIGEHFADTPRAGLLVPLVITMPAIVIALVALFSGWIVDAFGRAILLKASLILYAISGSSGLYLQSLEALLVGRALMGLATAGIMTAGLTLIADWLEETERTRFLGLQATFAYTSGILFLLAGGALASVHWRGPFAVYTLAAPLAIMAFLSIKDKEGDHPRSSAIRRSLASLPVLSIAVVYTAALTGMMAFYIIPTQLPFYLSEKFVLGSFAIGMILSLVNVVSAIVGLRFASISKRFRYWQLLTGIFAFKALGYTLLFFANNIAMLVLAMGVYGVGFGLLMPTVSTQLASLAPETVRGRLMGGLTSCLFFGQFLAPFAAYPAMKLGPPQAVSGLFLFCLIFCLLVGLTLCFLSKPSGRGVAHESKQLGKV